MKEKSNRLILIAIATGLWANALFPLIAPHSARAQNDDTSTAIQNLAGDVSDIADDVHKIELGTCVNDNICK